MAFTLSCCFLVFIIFMIKCLYKREVIFICYWKYYLVIFYWLIIIINHAFIIMSFLKNRKLLKYLVEPSSGRMFTVYYAPSLFFSKHIKALGKIQNNALLRNCREFLEFWNLVLKLQRFISVRNWKCSLKFEHFLGSASLIAGSLSFLLTSSPSSSTLPESLSKVQTWPVVPLRDPSPPPRCLPWCFSKRSLRQLPRGICEFLTRGGLGSLAQVPWIRTLGTCILNTTSGWLKKRFYG